MRPLRTFLSLSSAEKTVVFHSWGLILAAKAALPVAGLPRVTAFLDGQVKPLRHGYDALPPTRMAQLVAAAGRWTFGSSCLHRALVLLFLMRRRNAPARLAIGVNRGVNGNPDFSAHAWVEAPSEPRLPGHPADGEYTRLLEYEIQ